MKRILQVRQEQITFTLLTLFCMSLPLKNNLNSIAIILLAAFAFLLVVVNKQFDKQIFYRLTPLVVFFILTLVSTVYSEDKQESLSMVVRMLPFALFPFIFSAIQFKEKSFLKLLKIYVFWMLLLCFYSHTQILIKLYQNDDLLYNIFNSHYSYLNLSEETIGLHSTYYAYYVIIAIVFLTKFLFDEKSRIIKVVYLLMMGYFTFFVFHLSARLPIATLFLFYNIAIVYYFIKQKKLVWGIFFLLLLYFISSIVIYNVRITRYRFQHLTGFTYADGTRHDDGVNKILQWKASAAANNNFIFGNGIGDANQAIFDTYLHHDLEYYFEKKYNAHNQFIQTYVGLGLLGTAILLFIFGYYIQLFYRNRQLIPLVLLLLTFLLFQTESYLQRHNGVVMFGFLICFFANYGEKKKLPKDY